MVVSPNFKVKHLKTDWLSYLKKHQCFLTDKKMLDREMVQLFWIQTACVFNISLFSYNILNQELCPKQAHNHAVLNRECNHRVFQLPFSLSKNHELDVPSFSVFSFKTFCPKILNERSKWPKISIMPKHNSKA